MTRMILIGSRMGANGPEKSTPCFSNSRYLLQALNSLLKRTVSKRIPANYNIYQNISLYEKCGNT